MWKAEPFALYLRLSPPVDRKRKKEGGFAADTNPALTDRASRMPPQGLQHAPSTTVL